jgi:sugar/nucleoside kinase (ribokinase family)
VDALVRVGVTVFPVYTPHSTTLRLYYPTSNPDERVLSVTQTAGAFTPEQVRDLQSKAFLINGSIRGEVDLDVIRELKAKDTLLAADVQGFVRVVAPDGTLVYAPWPEKEQVLSHIDIVKTDAVEAEMLTGTADIKAAAEIIGGWGPREVVLTHRDGLLVFARVGQARVGQARVGQARGQFHQAPFCPRQLVGRSGRGDTCVASYVAKRLTAPPQEACIWAAAVTSLKLEAEGPIKRTVADAEELIERVYARL